MKNNRFLFITFLLFFYNSTCYAQKSEQLNQYGLSILNSVSNYKLLVDRDKGRAMADIRSVIPNVEFDFRYATTNNFMKQKLYPSIKTTYLRMDALTRLKLVQSELNSMGLGIKIFDAYRPYGITVKMWEMIHDDRYVADPSKGSGHNRGIAVDLTIVEVASQKELDMGTGYDNFTDSAHHSFMQLPPSVMKNRQLLKTLMEKNGFKIFETEWWHYSLPNANDYELLNLSFGELKRCSRN